MMMEEFDTLSLLLFFLRSLDFWLSQPRPLSAEPILFLFASILPTPVRPNNTQTLALLFLALRILCLLLASLHVLA